MFALFLYTESVMISSLIYNVFNIHIKYKVSRIKKYVMEWHPNMLQIGNIVNIK